GNVTAVQREFDNLSRVVITLASRRIQLQNDIDALSRKQQDTAEAADEARIQLDQSSAKLQELAATRAALEIEVAELERRDQGLQGAGAQSRQQWNAAKDALFEAERRREDRKSTRLN